MSDFISEFKKDLNDAAKRYAYEASPYRNPDACFTDGAHWAFKYVDRIHLRKTWALMQERDNLREALEMCHKYRTSLDAPSELVTLATCKIYGRQSKEMTIKALGLD